MWAPQRGMHDGNKSYTSKIQGRKKTGRLQFNPPYSIYDNLFSKESFSLENSGIFM